MARMRAGKVSAETIWDSAPNEFIASLRDGSHFKAKGALPAEGPQIQAISQKCENQLTMRGVNRNQSCRSRIKCGLQWIQPSLPRGQRRPFDFNARLPFLRLLFIRPRCNKSFIHLHLSPALSLYVLFLNIFLMKAVWPDPIASGCCLISGSFGYGKVRPTEMEKGQRLFKSGKMLCFAVFLKKMKNHFNHLDLFQGLGAIQWLEVLKTSNVA